LGGRATTQFRSSLAFGIAFGQIPKDAFLRWRWGSAVLVVLLVTQVIPPASHHDRQRDWGERLDSGHEYMLGTQCDHASGTWDVWNSGTLPWNPSGILCKRFVPNPWYHVTLTFHPTSPNHYEPYDQLTIVRHNSAGKVTANHSDGFNKPFPAQLTPPGWGDDLGVQFQMDIGSAGAQMQEWVDRVILTTW
jgi:hypothetical protein